MHALINATHTTIRTVSTANQPLSNVHRTIGPTRQRDSSDHRRWVSVTRSRETLTLKSTVTEGPETYRFETADGVHASDRFRDAELLLLETLWDRPLEDLLVVQGNYGVIGTVLAATTAVTMTETSARAVRLSRENVDRNGATANISLVTSPKALDSMFTTACYAPKPYTPIEVGKQRVVDALSVLRPGGRLYVSGRPSSGINRYERCLRDHAERVETVRQSGSYRVLEAARPDEFDHEQYVSVSTVTASVDGTCLTMKTRPGLFSPDSLDDGTRLLAETATVEDGDTVLDLGCGYGPLGAYAAASAAVDVILTDDDIRATSCAQATLDATGVDGSVVVADCLRGVDDRVDRVLCNPPTHAGTDVLSELFAGVSDVLDAGGELSLVHHRRLNLDDQLEQVGRTVDRRTRNEHTVVTVRP